ncbi:unnamed protein product, partial [Discosporangium mesarthrocarpum]
DKGALPGEEKATVRLPPELEVSSPPLRWDCNPAASNPSPNANPNPNPYPDPKPNPSPNPGAGDGKDGEGLEGLLAPGPCLDPFLGPCSDPYQWTCSPRGEEVCHPWTTVDHQL